MRINRKIKTPLLTVIFCILYTACSLQEDNELLQEPDLIPPRFLEITPTDSQEVHLLFDEPVRTETETLTLDSGETAVLEVLNGSTLVLKPQTDLIPGHLYKVSLTVEDLRGNSCRFILPFWGWNPDVPEILINELNPQGSDTNPDCIELYFPSGGNTAGVCLCYGTKNFYDYRYILPSLAVAAGDYMIIHCRREFLDNEVSELLTKTTSEGKLSSDEAWDLWLPEDQGLSGSNGVLTLYKSPGGALLDGIIYSDRDPDPEDDYLGWTSRTFDPVVDLYRCGGWKFSSDSLNPGETVSSRDTTATRSLCRNSLSEDTDSSLDWHTVPTSEKSFGSVNTDLVYTP